MDNPFVATVRESNLQGRGAWLRFAAHRDRLTRLLTSVGNGRSSLCILGAGNLNDVRLDVLLCTFAVLHLVDLDADTVGAGVARQGCEDSEAVRIHAPVDLTAILDRLPAGRPEEDAAHELLEVLDRRRTVVPGQPFDVTVSAGVLTQLLQSVVDSALDPDDIVRVSLALRDKHLTDLVHLTAPGGALILITDVVSTTTASQLIGMASADLEPEMVRLVAAGNFFTGTNPYRIAALLEEGEPLRGLVRDVRLDGPWLWDVTPDRQHLTCAIAARRTSRERAAGVGGA